MQIAHAGTLKLGTDWPTDAFVIDITLGICTTMDYLKNKQFVVISQEITLF